MFGWLLPRDGRFFDFIDAHGKLVSEACRLLHETIDTIKISKLEQEADLITHACVETLHKTFITPIDRDSIFRLISRLDDIIDYTDAAADRYTIYKIESPNESFKELSKILMESSQEVAIGLSYLHNLKNSGPLLDSCIKIHTLENRADTKLTEALAKLFESSMDIRLIIKWKEIYELVESAIDRTEDVANILEGIVLENS